MLDGRPSSVWLAPDAVHAEVARLLVTPGLPFDTRHGLIDGAACGRLMLFRAFITKIMHNGVRKFIPNTLRALSVLEIELQFFDDASPEYLRLRGSGPIPPARHLAWFKGFLAEWSVKHPQGAIVRDILTHELTLNESRDTSQSNRAVPAHDVPWIAGDLWLCRYRYDVPFALRQLAGGTLSPSEVALATPATLAYWRSSSGALALTWLDALTAVALARVDGKRTLAEIAQDFAFAGYTDVGEELLAKLYAGLSATTPLRLGPTP